MKLKGLRWCVLSLVAVATMINYIDRNALAVMWPGIAAEQGLGKEDYAAIITSFMLAYALGQSVFGKLFDALGTRLGFLLSIIVWSIAVALHAAARSLATFSLFRFLMGFGEAGNWPGATKANAEWFPVQERALAQGVFNAGASVGAMISAPLVAFLYLQFGWQATFIIVASLGVIWIVPWLLLYKSGPDKHPWLSDEERQHILSGQRQTEVDTNNGEEFAPGFFQLLRYRQSWSVILARFFLDPVWWLFVSWLPIYLADRFGFDVKQIGMFAWVPYVGAALGGVSGGWLFGVCLRRGWSVSKARRSVITLGCCIMLPSLLATAGASTPLLAVCLIAVILFGFQVAIGNIQTLPSDFYSGRSVGSLSGMGGSAAVVGVLITTWLVPAITTESYVPFFLLGAALVPLSLLSVWLVGPIKAVQAKPGQSEN